MRAKVSKREPSIGCKHLKGITGLAQDSKGLGGRSSRNAEEWSILLTFLTTHTHTQEQATIIAICSNYS